MPLSIKAKMSVTGDNLQRVATEGSVVLDKRLSHLSDIAHIAVDTLASPRALAEFLASPSELAEQIEEMLSKGESSACAFGVSDMAYNSASPRIIVSDMIYDRLSASGRNTVFWGFNLLIPGGVSYVCHFDTDRIFELLHTELSADYSTIHAADLREACGDVVGGESRYAILPSVGPDGVELAGILSLIRMHELYICGEFTVGASVYYLVAKSGAYLPDAERIALRTSSEQEAFLLHEYALCHMLRLDSLRSYSTSDGKSFEYTFSIDGAARASKLQLFTRMFLPNTDIWGIYPIYNLN